MIREEGDKSEHSNPSLLFTVVLKTVSLRCLRRGKITASPLLPMRFEQLEGSYSSLLAPVEARQPHPALRQTVAPNLAHIELFWRF